jgi:hypothetical protein
LNGAVLPEKSRAGSIAMTQYEQFQEDIPAFVRGTLDAARAQELIAAAEQDDRLRTAIEQERTLEGWLAFYEVPEPSSGLSARFWKRFHHEQAFGEEGGRRSGLLLKLAGPLAAAVLIATGLVLFFKGDDPVAPADTKPDIVAETPDEPDDDFLVQFVWEPDAEPETEERPTLEELRLLKQLADPAYADLDKVPHPEDLLLIQDKELLTQLAEQEVE